MTSGRGSVLGPDTFRRLRWWELKLECGHEVERTVKYKPVPGGSLANGWHPRPATDALPAPTRARCDYCPKKEDTDEQATQESD